jgi:spore maturation protein CgeB
VTREASSADIVVKASGVGFEDNALLEHSLAWARRGALRIFWDVDAPATLAELRANPTHPMHRALKRIDIVMTYGGGDPVVYDYRQIGAAECIPIYNALDPETHHPAAPDQRFAADLGFLGNRLPDREARVEDFFLAPAARLPGNRFLLGGAGWQDKPMAANVNYIGHVPTRDHNAFNSTPKAVLNISRSSMAENGFSPATRVFEAAGAAACMITDAWTGVDLFLKDGEEILVARDGQDVGDLLQALSPERAREIGQRALERVLREHTYAHRAAEADRVFRSFAGRAVVEAAE